MKSRIKELVEDLEMATLKNDDKYVLLGADGSHEALMDLFAKYYDRAISVAQKAVSLLIEIDGKE